MLNEYNISLEEITNSLTDYIKSYHYIYNHLEILETFFYIENFLIHIDKKEVLRFEDCVYDFIIKRPRQGRPNDFCLKSSNNNYYNDDKEKISEVYQFLQDIFVEEKLITY